MKTSSPLFRSFCLGALVVLPLSSCTTVVRPSQQASGGRGEAPLFGAGGSRPTIAGGSTATTAASLAPTTPPPRPTGINVDPSSTTTQTSTTTTTTGPLTAGGQVTTGAGPTTTAVTPPKPEVEERYGRPVPGRDDIIVNPFDPHGPPLKIRNLSSGRADYQSGDRLRNPNNPNQHIIVP